MTPGLAALFDAVSAPRAGDVLLPRRRRAASSPTASCSASGHWYVVGHDRDRDAPRAFRVDRIDGEPELGAAARSRRPPGIDPAEFVRADPLTYGEDQPVDAHVLVDAPRAGWVVDQLGEEAVVERRADGAVVVALAGREPRRVPLLGARPARPRRGARRRRSCAPTWSRGSTRSRASGVTP